MVEIQNFTVAKIDKKLAQALALVILKEEGMEEENISLALVSPKKIRELNFNYRKKDKETDVLSFETDQFLPEEIKKEAGLGEIVICPEIVRIQGKERKVSFEEEFARVFIHGFLHLLGYDHEKSREKAVKMRKKEKIYFSKIFNSPSKLNAKTPNNSRH